MSASGAFQSDGYINSPYSRDMGQEVYRPTTVFSYFPQDYYAPPASAGLLGPEFGIMDASTSLRRANFVNQMTFQNGIPVQLQHELVQRAQRHLDQPDGAAAAGVEPDEPRRPAQPPADARDDVGRDEDLDHRRRHRRAGQPNAVPRAPSALSGRDLVAVPGAEVRTMKHTRRDFLARTTCAALSASAIQATVRQWGLANLLATPSPTRFRPTIGRSCASSSTAASTPTTWSFPSTARTTRPIRWRGRRSRSRRPTPCR